MVQWRSQEFVFGGALLRHKGPKFEAECLDRGAVLGNKPPPNQLGGLGERCKLPQRGSRRSFDPKCISNALRALKTRLVVANVVSLWQIDAC